jgi:hypothetical protein
VLGPIAVLAVIIAFTAFVEWRSQRKPKPTANPSTDDDDEPEPDRVLILPQPVPKLPVWQHADGMPHELDEWALRMYLLQRGHSILGLDAVVEFARALPATMSPEQVLAKFDARPMKRAA